MDHKLLSDSKQVLLQSSRRRGSSVAVALASQPLNAKTVVQIIAIFFLCCTILQTLVINFYFHRPVFEESAPASNDARSHLRSDYAPRPALEHPPSVLVHTSVGGEEQQQWENVQGVEESSSSTEPIALPETTELEGDSTIVLSDEVIDSKTVQQTQSILFEEYTATKVAICITGQLSRLELQSKIENIFVNNAEDMIVHAFFMLGNDKQSGYVFRRSDFVDSPFTNFTADGLAEYTKLQVAKYQREHPDVPLLPFDATAEFYLQQSTKYTADRQWIESLDPAGGSGTLVQRAELYMRQFEGISRCMSLVERYETRTGNKFDLVARVRDDGYAMDKWKMDETYTKGMTTLDCQQWYGLHDMTYVFAREYASRVWHDMLEWRSDRKALDENIQKNSERYPQNPESWLFAVVKAHDVPVRKLSICDIPVITVRHTQYGLIAKDSMGDHIMAGVDSHLLKIPTSVVQTTVPFVIHLNDKREDAPNPYRRTSHLTFFWGQQCSTCTPKWSWRLREMLPGNFWLKLGGTDVRCGTPRKDVHNKYHVGCEKGP